MIVTTYVATTAFLAVAGPHIGHTLISCVLQKVAKIWIRHTIGATENQVIVIIYEKKNVSKVSGYSFLTDMHGIIDKIIFLPSESSQDNSSKFTAKN